MALTANASIGRRFVISTNRRLPATEPKTWTVSGACEPDPFDSLAGARLFTQRENKKYINGNVRPFVPTHMILWQPPQSPAVKRRIPVRMVPPPERVDDLTALYKEEEWKPCIIPEWQYDPFRDRLVLDEIMMGRSWRIVPYEEGFAEFIWLQISEYPDRANFRPW